MMKVKRGKLLTASLLAMLALSGCKREATGQVVAVVNGEEITRQEVNAELNGDALPPSIDPKSAQQALLQRIIKRRLVAASARADGIDKDQEYLLKQKQNDDSLLIQLLAEKTERTFRIPDGATIDKYIAAHPTVFGQRTVYQVDQIMFPVPSDVNKLRLLKDDHTLDAVGARLTSLNIKFKRGTGEVDGSKLSPDMLSQIKKLPPGEPFLTPQPGGFVVAVITGSALEPMSPSDARPIAVTMMRKEAVDQALKQRLRTARAEAKIEYQPGFAPPTK